VTFEDAVQEVLEMHHRKNQDYGTGVDPYANVRQSAEWGIAPWLGSMVRANDKVKRLQKYARDGRLVNEGVRDSLLDLATYTLIALVLWDQQQSEGVEDDEPWACANCGDLEPPIFLCDAGWWCEKCYREFSGVPEETSSEDLHDGINDGSQAGYIEQLKAVWFSEDPDEVAEVLGAGVEVTN
jgi:hypothetical protein